MWERLVGLESEIFGIKFKKKKNLDENKIDKYD